MADYTLSAKIVGDSSSLNKSINKANSTLSEFKKETSNTSKQSTKAFNQISKEGEKTTQKLSTDFSSLKNKIAGLVAGLGLTKLAIQGISYNANIEQLQTSFEVMTGSADKARDVIDKLKKIGAETPFELSQLAETTQLLMNYGFTADEAIERMMMLGDISQGNSEKMSRIATAYGQMSSAGKVSLEDIKQMIEAGFNPLQEISDTTGESMSSLYDRISKGTLSIDEIAASMQRSTSEGGKYFQSMDKQSQTLNGKWSTLKDTFNEFLGNALQPITNFMRDTLLPAAIDVLSNFEKYKPILEPIATVLGILTLAFIAYNIQMALATAETTLFTLATSALGSVFAFLTSPITLIILAIAALVAIFVYLWKTNETFRNIVIQAWTSIQATLSNIWNNIIKPIFLEIAKIAMDIWYNGIQPLWEKIQEFVVFLIAALAQMWNKIAPFVNMFVEYFGGIIVDVIVSLVAFFGGAFTEITNTIGAWLNNIKQIVNGIKQIFSGVIDFITGVFTGNWSKAWQGVVDIFGGIFNTLSGVLKAPFNAVIGLINAAISGLNKISIKIPDWVPGLGGQKFGVDIPTMPYLKRGTNDFAGGFARINEGGRGELVNLPNGTQVIPHDISTKYAKESARINRNYTTDIDYSKLGEYIVKASNIYAQKIADGLVKGVSNIKVISNNRETARFLLELGFVKG